MFKYIELALCFIGIFICIYGMILNVIDLKKNKIIFSLRNDLIEAIYLYQNDCLDKNDFDAMNKIDYVSLGDYNSRFNIPYNELCYERMFDNPEDYNIIRPYLIKVLKRRKAYVQ